MTFSIPSLHFGQEERSSSKRENVKKKLLKFLIMKIIA